MELIFKPLIGKLDPNIREMLLGSLAGLAIKVLSAVSIFIMNIAIARALGPAEAGLFFLGFTLITLVATVGRFGMDQALVRFIAANHSTGSIGLLYGVYRKAVSWVAFGSLLLSAVAWSQAESIAIMLFNQVELANVLKAMLVAVPLVALYTMQAQALQGLKKVARSLLVLNVLLPLLLLILMLISPVSSAATLAEHFIVASLLTLLAGIGFWKQAAPGTESVEVFPSALLRSTCMPLWNVAILSLLVQWSSQLMLGAWSTAEEVAFFATAQRTAMLISFVLFAVNAIAAPKFAAMHARGDHQGLKRMSVMSVRMMLLASIPALVVMLTFPGWLMSFFGTEFTAAADALVILAMGQFVNIATGSVGYLLSMTGHERKVRNNLVISAALGIGLGMLLIPGYGLNGAAIATSLAIASQNLLAVYQVRKQLGFNTLIFWK